ncbi:conjugal transfer protein [Pseudoroseomonas aestuarii]|uniref:Conjugal transfer protein n=1 Tax=Teichococcus aestuarii TaxID=568898 RepID=A0A2U1UYV8_9PROT|nr:conjugal transfer protein [Pseudoroseomonas aestuarii]
MLAMAPVCAPTVDRGTLLAVISTESGFHPFAVATNAAGRTTSSRRFGSADEAAAAVEDLLSGGIDNIDLGLAQINYRAGHLQRLSLPVTAAFDPCTALSVAADVLVDCWSRFGGDRPEPERLDAMLSCYNTGTPARGLSNGYVGKVHTAYQTEIVPALRRRDADGTTAVPPPRPDAPISARLRCDVPAWDVWARCPQPDAAESPPSDPEPAAPARLRGITMEGPNDVPLRP